LVISASSVATVQSIMKIDIYMSEICGSYHELRANLEQALAELTIKPDVTYHTIYYDDAISRDIKGSPSIWINGRDAFEGGNSPGIT
jgi:hypothetical protein